MEILKFVIRFVAEYPGELITIIIGLPTIYVLGIKLSDKLFMKILVTLLLFGVVAVCVYDFSKTNEADPPAATREPTVQTTEATKEVVLHKLVEADYERVIASSMYKSDNKNHYPRYLLDDDPSTNWTEGVVGHGEGQSVDFIFKEEQIVAGFLIRAGNHSSTSYYLKNARPATVEISFQDDSSQEFKLEDIKEEQKVMFEEPVKTSCLCLTIQSVYEGTTYSDTVISDFTVLIYESVHTQ